jgi:hypothetical protein
LWNQQRKQKQSHLLPNHRQDEQKQVSSRELEFFKKIPAPNSAYGDKKVKILIPAFAIVAF